MACALKCSRQVIERGPRQQTNNIVGLLAYKVIWLSMAKEDGAGRDEANPQQVRECTR